MGIRPHLIHLLGVELSKDQEIPSIPYEEKVRLIPLPRNKKGEIIYHSDIAHSHLINTYLTDKDDNPKLLYDLLRVCVIDEDMPSERVFFGYVLKELNQRDFLYTLACLNESFWEDKVILVPSSSARNFSDSVRMYEDMIALSKKQGIKTPLAKFREFHRSQRDVRKIRRLGRKGWLWKDGEYWTTWVARVELAKTLFKQVDFKLERDSDLKQYLLLNWC